MNPLVSFVVPAFNYGRYLNEALDSIAHQSLAVDYEIIVVDDASTDETPDVVRAFDDSRLFYVRHLENCGTTATIIHGLEMARGTYIAELSADDRYRPDFLSHTMPILEQNTDVGMVYGDVAAIDADGNLLADPWEGNISRQLHQHRAFKGNELELMLLHNPAASQARLMRSALVTQELPFPKWLYPRFGPFDWYENVRVAREQPVYYIPRTLADYRIHAKNQHRCAVVSDYSERTIIQTLDQLFDESPRVLQGHGIKQRVFGIAYLSLADHYFGIGHFADARRCYLEALRWQPRTFLAAGGMHRLLGTVLGEKRYARVKNILRSLLVRSE